MVNKKKVIILSAVLLILLFLVYLVFPNKPVFLGQWSIITNGQTVDVIGQDITVFAETIKHVKQQAIDWPAYTYGKLVFTVNGEEKFFPSPNFNQDFTLRNRPLNFFGHSFEIFQVQKTEKLCDHLFSTDHTFCYMSLVNFYDDVSYCDEISVKINDSGIARCYWAYAWRKKDVSLCELMPMDVPYAENWKQRCYEDIE